jgi:hypothetical protein
VYTLQLKGQIHSPYFCSTPTAYTYSVAENNFPAVFINVTYWASMREAESGNMAVSGEELQIVLELSCENREFNR